MKKIISLFLLATFALCLVSCSGAGQPSYRNDTTCAILFENAEKKLTLDEGFEFMEKGELAVMSEPSIGGVLDKLDDSAFRFTGGSSFDEYGILHVAVPEDVESVKSAVEEYLKAKREDALYRSYFPGEEYKLDDAQVQVYGNYVVYGMLSEENRTALFNEVKQLLLDA
ncbi:MAG: DUF4358 domain-containing protein [Clostridia bacterium]|nr:DUF4358 domain-containing protein [Clostridia bacterium]